MFNCRRLSNSLRAEINVFAQLFLNWWFVIVVLIVVNFLYAIENFAWLGFLFGTTELTVEMHLLSGILGAGSIAVGTLVKMVPLKWVPKFSDIDSEDAKVTRFSFSSFDGSLTLQKQTSKALLADHNLESQKS